jgi:hypothetical protein
MTIQHVAMRLRRMTWRFLVLMSECAVVIPMFGEQETAGERNRVGQSGAGFESAFVNNCSRRGGDIHGLLLRVLRCSPCKLSPRGKQPVHPINRPRAADVATE